MSISIPFSFLITFFKRSFLEDCRLLFVVTDRTDNDGIYFFFFNYQFNTVHFERKIHLCTLHQCSEAVWILLQQKQKISSNKEEFFVKKFNPNLIDYF